MPKKPRKRIDQAKQTYVKPKVRTDWYDELDYKVPEKLQAEIDELEKRAQDSKPNSQAIEQIQETHELNVEAVKENRFQDQDIVEDEAPRIGRMLHHLKFLEMLRSNGVRAWYNEVPFRGLIGLRCVVPSKEQLGLQYVCGVQMGWMAEYDAYHFDENGLPLNRKRVGWRSVLIMLIAKGMLTEEKAHKIFGHPPVSVASTIYRKALWEMRNARAYGQEVKVDG